MNKYAATDSLRLDSPGRTSNRSDSRKFLLPIIILSVLLAALLFLLYLFSRPMNPVGVPTVKEHEMSIYGFGPERMKHPSEVAVNSRQEILVTDTGNHRVLVFDKTGAFITKFGKVGSKYGQFKFPAAITIDNEGRVYVASPTQNKIVIFNRKYKPIWEILVPYPLAMTIKKNKLYIATDHEIMIGDLQGNKLSGFGSKGRGPKELDRPSGIAVDDKGNIYVADTLNYRVSAFTPKGKILWQYGRTPPQGLAALKYSERDFGLPVGMELGPDGHLYLLDSLNAQIVIMDKKTGKEISRFGKDIGSADGELNYPDGITHAWGGSYAVADKYNNRVQILGLGAPTGPSMAGRLPRWLALLPLLLLLPLFFLRRKGHLLADGPVLENAAAGGQLGMLAKKAKSILVTSETYGKVAHLEQHGKRIDSLLKIVEPDAKLVNDVSEELQGFETDTVKLIAAALGLKKARVLSENKTVGDFLRKKSIQVFTLREFLGGKRR